jgi:hypothetical protein
MMFFLLESEYNYTKKIGNNEDAMEKIERSMDEEIFKKFFMRA